MKIKRTKTLVQLVERCVIGRDQKQVVVGLVLCAGERDLELAEAHGVTPSWRQIDLEEFV